MAMTREQERHYRWQEFAAYADRAVCEAPGWPPRALQTTLLWRCWVAAIDAANVSDSAPCPGGAAPLR